MRKPSEPRDRIYVKGYRFLSLTKYDNKLGQKNLDNTKKSATDALKIASKDQSKEWQKQQVT